MAQTSSPLETFLSGKLANELRYAGNQFKKGNIPYVGKPRFTPDQMRSMTAPGLGSQFPPGTGLNAIDTGKYGPSDWNPSANPQPIVPTSASGPAQRNYEAEKSRAAQLAMQDQLSKKYQVADLTKAYNTATPEEKEKIGLQIM